MRLSNLHSRTLPSYCYFCQFSCPRGEAAGLAEQQDIKRTERKSQKGTERTTDSERVKKLLGLRELFGVHSICQFTLGANNLFDEHWKQIHDAGIDGHCEVRDGEKKKICVVSLLLYFSAKDINLEESVSGVLLLSNQCEWPLCSEVSHHQDDEHIHTELLACVRLA